MSEGPIRQALADVPAAPRAALVAELLRPWTIAELADACRVSESYVRKCIKAGALSVHRAGRALRIAAPDALSFAADLGAVLRAPGTPGTPSAPSAPADADPSIRPGSSRRLRAER